MPLHVYTARLPHHGRKGYFGKDALNITRGSGEGLGLVFAPSKLLLNEGQKLRKAAKNKGEAAQAEAWAWYVPRYLDEMRAVWMVNRAAFTALLSRERVTLLCYCGTAHRCHRRLLAEILVKLGAVDCGEVSTESAAAKNKALAATTWAEAEAKVPGGPDLDEWPM